MNIGLFLWTFCAGKGGIERVGSKIANAMIKRGHSVTIFCCAHELAAPQYFIEDKVKLVRLNSLKYKKTLDDARIALKDNNIDVLCAMCSNDIAITMPHILQGTGIAFIYSEHSDPEIILSKRWNSYERLGCFAASDHIHLLLNQFKKSIPDCFQQRITVIPNPAPSPANVSTYNLHKDEVARVKRILAVGRLQESPKNFSCLIHAFALIAEQFSDWEVVIAGEGNDRGYYQNIINKCKLNGKIVLLGNIDDIDSFYKSGDIYCVSSVFEGLPVATAEAQSFGLPLVGFAECSGVNEIIQNDVNGILVDSMTASALADALARLMVNAELRHLYGENSLELGKRYNENDIFDKWENLFLKAYQDKLKTKLDAAINTNHFESFSNNALIDIVSREDPFDRQYTLENYKSEKRVSKRISQIESKLDMKRRKINSVAQVSPLCIGILSLNFCTLYGGAEKFTLTIANEMVYRGHKVIIFYSNENNYKHNPFMLTDLNEKIQLINISLNIEKFKHISVIQQNLSQLKKSAKEINSASIDVLLSIVGWFSADCVYAGLSKYLTVPTITTARGNPFRIQKTYTIETHCALILRATRFHVLFPSYKKVYPSFLKEKMVDIPNSIKITNIPSIKHKVQNKKIIAIGRHDDGTKNFSLLLRAFMLLANKFPDWTLTICGDGHSYATYNRFINDNNLASQIFLPGAVKNVNDYLENSDIFCIPSLYEGFPNVLLEAQANMLPAVGFRDCPGVNEVIVHMQNGLLATERTPESLASSLEILMLSHELSLEMGKNAYAMLARYEYTKTYDKWECVLYETATTNNRWDNTKAEELYIKNIHNSLVIDNINYKQETISLAKQLKHLQTNDNDRFKAIDFGKMFKNSFLGHTTLQKLILIIYTPFVFAFAGDKKFYKDFKYNTRFYFSYTKNPFNIMLKKVLSFFGSKLD